MQTVAALHTYISFNFNHVCLCLCVCGHSVSCCRKAEVSVCVDTYDPWPVKETKARPNVAYHAVHVHR